MTSQKNIWDKKTIFPNEFLFFGLIMMLLRINTKTSKYLNITERMKEIPKKHTIFLCLN
jgi:hypothetical protein